MDNETAVRFTSSRQAPSAEELQRLAMEATFSAKEVRISRINLHQPPLDKIKLDHLAATPVASVIAAADPGARNKIGTSVMKQMQRYGDGDGVTFPEETLVLTAQVR